MNISRRERRDLILAAIIALAGAVAVIIVLVVIVRTIAVAVDAAPRAAWHAYQTYWNDVNRQFTQAAKTGGKP